MESRKCKRCGKLFIPNNARQCYCNEEITVSCSVCGNPIKTICNPNKIPSTCSKICSTKASITKEHTCPICGSTFIPTTHRQTYCRKTIEKSCEICGVTYKTFCGDKERHTCGSITCTNKYKQKQVEASLLKTERICVLCGEIYHPTNNAQKYCKKLHPIKCKICGKVFITDTSKQDFATTCSKECRYKSMIDNRSPEEVAIAVEKAKKTNLEKYGVEHPAQNPEILKKMQQTSFERYGDTAYVRTNEYIEKSIQTNRERYGADWAAKTQANKEKRKKTNIERHGVENPAVLESVIQKAKDTYFSKTGYSHPFKNPEVLNKRNITNIKRYGAINPLTTEQIREKSKRTLLDRYGVDSPLKSEDILNKVYATALERYGNISYLGSKKNRKDMQRKMLEKYGVPYHSKSKQWKADRMMNPDKIDNWLKFLDDPKAWLTSYESKPNLHQLELDLGVSHSTIMYWIIYYNLTDLVKYTLSSIEDDIVQLIKSIDASIVIKQHERKFLPGKELDIVLHEYKIALECDPTVTHNSSIGDPWGGNPKQKEYHKIKTDLCENSGYKLYHIFGYELTNRMDFVESNIRYLIDKPKYIINGSDCSIINIDKDLSDSFIQENSINPPTKASVRYGLLIDDKLVSVMTFGKLHKSKYITDTENSWEIMNMCTKLHTKVVDGYSILFNKFINEFNPNYILATSDRSWESEKDYESLGFSKIDITEPICIWIDSKTDLPYYEYETRKCNLNKLLEGVEIDSEKTEKEILEENGFLQVFDSGKTIWKF